MGERTEGSLDDGTLRTNQLAEAAWSATRDERSVRYHGRGSCRTGPAPYGTADPYGRRVHETCRTSGCLDLHHELLTRLLKKLGTRPIQAGVVNPGGYTYRVARTELIELKRSERTALGFPAKPTRSDGAAGRVGTALAAAGGPVGEWLVTLFRILRSYPFSSSHVPGRWPVEGLAEERMNYFPDEADHVASVRQDIATVLACATRLVGAEWVYDNLTLPLNAGRTSALPEAAPTVRSDETDALMGRMLWQRYLRHRSAGCDPHEALERGAREVTGLGVPHASREVRTALDEFEDAAASYAIAG